MTGAQPPVARLAGATRRAASAGARRLRGPGALMILALCFGGSAIARLADPEGALAGQGGAQEDAARAPADCPDPAGLLAALREREVQLDARAARIADRARRLEVAEAKLEEQTQALQEAEARLADTLAIADKAAEADLDRMVGVYQNMKPKEAAEIFSAMDVTFAAGFLARMREDAAARILGGIPPERAYAISAVIAGRNAGAPRE
ncbi:MAG: MotE family protein [Pseudomonadota bacterium]